MGKTTCPGQIREGVCAAGYLFCCHCSWYPGSSSAGRDSASPIWPASTAATSLSLYRLTTSSRRAPCSTSRCSDSAERPSHSLACDCEMASGTSPSLPPLCLGLCTVSRAQCAAGYEVESKQPVCCGQLQSTDSPDAASLQDSYRSGMLCPLLCNDGICYRACSTFKRMATAAAWLLDGLLSSASSSLSAVGALAACGAASSAALLFPLRFDHAAMCAAAVLQSSRSSSYAACTKVTYCGSRAYWIAKSQFFGMVAWCICTRCQRGKTALSSSPTGTWIYCECNCL